MMATTTARKKYRGVEEVFGDLADILKAGAGSDVALVAAVSARIKMFTQGCRELELSIFMDPRWTDICLKHGPKFRRGVGAQKR